MPDTMKSSITDLGNDDCFFGLNAPLSHHNCVTAIMLEYSDKIKSMPLEKQCTVYLRNRRKIRGGQ